MRARAPGAATTKAGDTDDVGGTGGIDGGPAGAGAATARAGAGDAAGVGGAADAAEEFAGFVASSYRRLTHAADLLTGDRARAEDLVQHALVRAYLKWPGIRDGNPEAYTRKIIVNAYLDWWRRLRWRELPEQTADQSADPRAVLPDLAVDVARRDAVQRALGLLTRRERAVVVLRFWCDLGEAQIAAELGMPRGTVKSTLSRAVGRLRADPELSAAVIDTKGPVQP